MMRIVFMSNTIITCLLVVAGIGLTVAIAAIARALRMPQAKGSMTEVSLRLARWIVASLLAASGIWMAAAPRADHPLLDAVERAFPAIRSAYTGDSTDVARAREEHRWSIAGVLLVLAASFVVSLPSKRTTNPRP
jgi:hypothetical protein